MVTLTANSFSTPSPRPKRFDRLDTYDFSPQDLLYPYTGVLEQLCCRLKLLRQFEIVEAIEFFVSVCKRKPNFCGKNQSWKHPSVFHIFFKSRHQISNEAQRNFNIARGVQIEKTKGGVGMGERCRLLEREQEFVVRHLPRSLEIGRGQKVDIPGTKHDDFDAQQIN